MDYSRLSPGPGFRLGPVLAHCCERAVVLPALRAAVDWAIARKVAATQPAPAASRSLGEEAALLRREGLLRLGPLLDAQQLAAIACFLRDKPRYDAADRAHRLNPPGIETAAVTGYPPEVILNCPHLLEVAHDPYILGLCGAYLQCKPTIISWGLLSAGSTERPALPTQRFHRDREGWRSLKLFVYLTNVGAADGPHVYARGSHQMRSSLRARSYSDAETEALVGAANIERITDAAGCGFVADPFGLHKGLPPSSGGRLILQIHYAMLPSPVYRYAPIRLTRAWPPVDPYVNRLFVAGAAAAPQAVAAPAAAEP